MKKYRKVWVALSVLAGLSWHGHLAQATTLSFDNITNNKAADAAVGEAQLFVDVVSYAAGKVLFVFRNIGPAACSITDVYFDNGSPAKTQASLFGLIDKDNGVGGDAGVDFTPLASPSNLPGGGNISPAFLTTLGFSADSDRPVQANGVNPGEKLGVIFTLLSGKVFSDVLGALGNGDLRIGIHVQGFQGGGSESFVTNKAVPEPATIGLVAAALISLATTKRRSVI